MSNSVETLQGVRAAADRALRLMLEGRPIEALDIREEEDWMGEPSLHVDVTLALGGKGVDGDLSLRLRQALSRELLAVGERRFPYLHLRQRGDVNLNDEPETV